MPKSVQTMFSILIVVGYVGAVVTVILPPWYSIDNISLLVVAIPVLVGIYRWQGGEEDNPERQARLSEWGRGE